MTYRLSHDMAGGLYSCGSFLLLAETVIDLAGELSDPHVPVIPDTPDHKCITRTIPGILRDPLRRGAGALTYVTYDFPENTPESCRVLLSVDGMQRVYQARELKAHILARAQACANLCGEWGEADVIEEIEAFAHDEALPALAHEALNSTTERGIQDYMTAVLEQLLALLQETADDPGHAVTASVLRSRLLSYFIEELA